MYRFSHFPHRANWRSKWEYESEKEKQNISIHPFAVLNYWHWCIHCTYRFRTQFMCSVAVIIIFFLLLKAVSPIFYDVCSRPMSISEISFFFVSSRSEKERRGAILSALAFCFGFSCRTKMTHECSVVFRQKISSEVWDELNSNWTTECQSFWFWSNLYGSLYLHMCVCV